MATMDDLLIRIKRIYAAIDAIEENDIKKFSPKVMDTGRRIIFLMDWKGELNDEQVSNYAHTLIHNIANLKDNLRQWASKNDKDKVQVDDVFNNSDALKIIQDLSNNDKHGYPPHHSISGMSPKIDKFQRVMQLSTGDKPGSSVGMAIPIFNKPNEPNIFISGSGSAKVIVTGIIMDNNNNVIGDFHRTALDAIQALEEFFANYGIKL